VPGGAKYLAFGDAYHHGDTIRAISLEAAGSAPTSSTPLRFPVLRARRPSPTHVLREAVRLVAAHAPELARSSSSPSCRGRPAYVAAPADVAALATRLREHDVLLIADGGRRLRPHRHPVRQRAVRHPADLLCLGRA
jgi:hypothetical protein